MADPQQIRQSIIDITNSRKWGKDYSVCNQFTDAIGQQFFGMSLPKIGSGYHAKSPIGAIHADRYFKGRGYEEGSDVRKISPDEARKIAASGGLVYMTGNGHITILAPNDKKLEVYRERPVAGKATIGLKNAKNWNFFHIDVPKYKQYDMEHPDEYKGDFVKRRYIQSSYGDFVKQYPQHAEFAERATAEEIKPTYDSQVQIDQILGTSEWRENLEQQRQVRELTR